ncbi:hypothetical protein ACQ4PT_050057 [Festuca glaucescens]
MDRVEGLMRGLKLSEAESKGVKFGGGGALIGRGAVKELQAVGKLLAEKPAIVEAISDALGLVWCPMKGIHCKELGENIFLFTFYQAGGRKKAVDSGPWMFEKDLIVLEEFDPAKTIDQYKFNSIPIWVRMYKLPLGMMRKEIGVSIGERIGEFMEMDGVEDGMAIGKCLRVKVRMNINKPLMRGTLVEVDEKGRTVWCNFEYEFLPDFCFICGILGHVQKECDIKLKRDEEPQYGKWLKWMPPRRNNFSTNKVWNERGNKKNYSMTGSGSKLGSDAPSWRKYDGDVGYGAKLIEGSGKEVSNPLRAVFGSEQVVLNDVVQNKNNAMVIDKGNGNGSTVSDLEGKEKKQEGGRDLNMGKEEVLDAKTMPKKYKKVARTDSGSKGEKVVVGGKNKRGDEMDVDSQRDPKKGKGLNGKEMVKVTEGEILFEAGLSGQLRGSQ